MVTQLQYTGPKLVQSLAFLCVYGDKIAIHGAEIGSHWPLYVCMVTKLLIHCTKIVVICLFICVH